MEIGVSRTQAAGFIEKNAISKHQEEVLWRLKSADEHGRLHIFFPTDPDLSAGQQITVHAKLMVVDDRWLTVGSANFNNRSMGLDTECNLVLDAHGDSANRARISAYVSKSVAHFLKIDPASLPDIDPARCSLSEEIAKRLPSPYLQRMPMENVGGWLSSQDIEEMPIVDPLRPYEIEQAVDAVFFQKDRKRLLASVPLGLILTLGFCFAVAVLWVAFPLSEFVGSEKIVTLLDARKSSGFVVVFSVGIFVISTLILIPLNLLIIVAAVVIPGPQAFWVILLSAMVAAVVGYGEGRVLGVRVLERLIPNNFKDLKRQMLGKSTLAIALFRLVPLAQFGLVNCVAGSLHLSFLNYFVGTFIGILPGVLSLFLLQKSLLQLCRVLRGT